MCENGGGGSISVVKHYIDPIFSGYFHGWTCNYYMQDGLICISVAMATTDSLATRGILSICGSSWFGKHQNIYYSGCN